MSTITAHINDYLSQPKAAPIARVLRHRKLFLAVFGITFCLVAILVMILPEKYESEMKLLVSTERPDLVISPDDSKNTAAREELPEIRLNSEIELLKSNDVMEQVLDKIGLGTQPNATDHSPAATAAYRERAINSLASHLKIEPVKKSEVISVTYRAKSPQMANEVLKSLSDTYLELHLKAHATPGSFKFFDDQAKVYAQQLAEAEQRMLAFRQQNPANAQPDQQDPLIQREMDAQAALDETAAQEADYGKRVQTGHAELSALDPRVSTQVRVSPQSAIISQLNGMLADLQNRRTEMATKFRPDDRMVTQLDKEIADTQATLDNVSKTTSTEQTTDLNQVRVEAEKSLVSSETMLSGLKARRGELNLLVNTYKGRVLQNAGAGVDSERLARQLKESEDNYLLYSKKREEARISESLDQQRITDVSLVEAPTMPVKPASPIVPLDLAIGFLLSLLVAYLSVVLQSRFGSTSTATQRIDANSAFAAASAN